ncbi:MAG TPA: GTP-binding protein [Candidatus Cottocaccamicrobium excrementipullorum]|nr:GTP-binding protein [Candidatus Cottocaccamicrobium excrementipullorum]
MTKIDVISGFLGAGKTTFIKKLLEEAIAGEQVVLIENEFGEIGIDGGFLKDAGIEIREMNSGCICCSLVGDFGKSLQEVITRYQPQRVIIEPSGVGKLSDVMKAVRDVSADLDVTLNSSVTVVDVKKCKMYMKNFGEFFNNQIQYAGNIVLSRTDIADHDKVEAAVAMIRELNDKASIITTPIDQLTGAQLLEIIEKPDTMMEDLMAEVQEQYSDHDHHHHHDEHCGCGHDHHHEDHDHDHEHHHDHSHGHEECCHEDHDHHDHDHGDSCSCGCHDHDHHHHHADEVFTSWGLETAAPVKKEDLEKILESLAETTHYGEVLRAKGMLPTETPGQWLYFDLVPEQYEIREGSPDYTGKVCVIGARLKEDELNKAFGRG